jgi:hypothetical protein
MSENLGAGFHDGPPAELRGGRIWSFVRFR